MRSSRLTHTVIVLVLGLLSGFEFASAQAQKYPPLEKYMMPRDSEIALAKSAAPKNISDLATIKVLTSSGFEVASQGSNGFVCEVMRGWAAPTYTPAQFRDLVYDPTVHAPICFNAVAAREVLPYYELRHKIGMQGKTPSQIAEGLEAAYVRGELPRRSEVSFAYMWSADQFLFAAVGHWHPHIMVFVPYADNSMLGGHPFGSALPYVSDDAGTPFAVIVIPVDDNLFIKAGQK